MKTTSLYRHNDKVIRWFVHQNCKDGRVCALLEIKINIGNQTLVKISSSVCRKN